MGIEAAAQKLLNPEGNDFDVALLDDVVNAAYSPTDPNRAMANKALMALQETEHLWTKADTIMERAQNPQSRFFGLQVLDDAIRTRFVFCSAGIFSHPITALISLTYVIYQVEGSPNRAARRYQELCCWESYSGVV
jgi:hypothetical protein